jgi:hypothetical protein
MRRSAPGELEICAYFRAHLGPRFEAARLRVQFHYNQPPGIHFKAESPEEYRAAIIRGIKEGLALRFPMFPSSGTIWITEVIVHEIDSSQRAFYRALRLAIDQAHSLCEVAEGEHSAAL